VIQAFPDSGSAAKVKSCLRSPCTASYPSSREQEVVFQRRTTTSGSRAVSLVAGRRPERSKIDITFSLDGVSYVWNSGDVTWTATKTA
jgi:hypothetical protein